MVYNFPAKVNMLLLSKSLTLSGDVDRVDLGERKFANKTKQSNRSLAGGPLTVARLGGRLRPTGRYREWPSNLRITRIVGARSAATPWASHRSSKRPSAYSAP